MVVVRGADELERLRRLRGCVQPSAESAVERRQRVQEPRQFRARPACACGGDQVAEPDACGVVVLEPEEVRAHADRELRQRRRRTDCRPGKQLQSAATAGEGTQNILCVYLSLAILGGLRANAVFGLWWADPTVALIVAIVAVQAGVQTWRGQGCADAC